MTCVVLLRVLLLYVLLLVAFSALRAKMRKSARCAQKMRKSARCAQNCHKSARCAQNFNESARENKMGNVGNNVTCVTVVSVRSLPK